MLDDSLINALKSGFSSSVQKIRIPSLGNEKREFHFREPTVREVNTISKIILSNSNSQSTIYASTLVFLKYLCIDSDFNPYDMNEIDRLKLITYILSGIFFSKNLTIRCNRSGCGMSFPFSLKYGDIIKKLDGLSTREFIFENKTSAGDVKVVAKFPSAGRYLDFLEYVDGIKNTAIDYSNFNDAFVEIDSTKSDGKKTNGSDSAFVEKIIKRREILKGKIKKASDDKSTLVGNVDLKKMGSEKKADSDFSYLYIDKMTITNIPNSKDDYELKFGGLNYEESMKLLDVIPMRLLVREDGSDFMKFVKTEFEKALNGCSPSITCPNCGNDVSKRIGIQNFFIHG